VGRAKVFFWQVTVNLNKTAMAETPKVYHVGWSKTVKLLGSQLLTCLFTELCPITFCSCDCL